VRGALKHNRAALPCAQPSAGRLLKGSPGGGGGWYMVGSRVTCLLCQCVWPCACPLQSSAGAQQVHLCTVSLLVRGWPSTACICRHLLLQADQGLRALWELDPQPCNCRARGVWLRCCSYRGVGLTNERYAYMARVIHQQQAGRGPAGDVGCVHERGGMACSRCVVQEQVAWACLGQVPCLAPPAAGVTQQELVVALRFHLQTRCEEVHVRVCD
jgi:hypothetical protein